MTIKNILVAYNGGAASNAAVSLALQMAAKYDAHLTGIAAHGASSVTRNIPSWISASMRETIGSATQQRQIEVERMFKAFTSGKIDLVTILARHDIEAEHAIIPKSGSIAETLLAYGKSVEAGLLVMGVYQHSKLSEDIFGGVTTEMISKTHLPLFLSH